MAKSIIDLIQRQPQLPADAPEQQQFQRLLKRLVDANSLGNIVDGYVFEAKGNSPQDAWKLTEVSFASVNFVFGFHHKIFANSMAWSSIGTFRSKAPADGAVAALIAHEIGHALVYNELGGGAVSFLIGALHLDSLQRKLELKVDLIGMMLMAQAGFNPKDALNFWTERHRQETFNRLSGLTPTQDNQHPSSQEREHNLFKHYQEAKQAYEAHKNDKF